MAEERLDALAGIPDVIGQIARAVELNGKVKGKARRAMTPALAIRFTLLMTLMADGYYAEVLAALLGDLAPFLAAAVPAADRDGGLRLAGGARARSAAAAAGPGDGRDRRRAP